MKLLVSGASKTVERLAAGSDALGILITPNTLPWEHLEAVFIGGDTAWKTGREARAITEKAQAKGKLVHMGRVNTRGRYLIAKEWGVDTIDGSGFSQFPDTRIPMFLDWRKEA